MYQNLEELPSTPVEIESRCTCGQAKVVSVAPRIDPEQVSVSLYNQMSPSQREQLEHSIKVACVCGKTNLFRIDCQILES